MTDVFWKVSDLNRKYETVLAAKTSRRGKKDLNKARECLLKMYPPFLAEWKRTTFDLENDSSPEVLQNGILPSLLENRWRIKITKSGHFGDFQSKLVSTPRVLDLVGRDEQEKYVRFPNLYGYANVQLSVAMTDSDINAMIRELRTEWKTHLTRGSSPDPKAVSKRLSLGVTFIPKKNDSNLFFYFATSDKGYEGTAATLKMNVIDGEVLSSVHGHWRSTVRDRVTAIQSFIDPMNWGKEWYEGRRQTYSKLKGPKKLPSQHRR